jgi:hypothetical protein
MKKTDVNIILQIVSKKKVDLENNLHLINLIADKKEGISTNEVRALIKLIKFVFEKASLQSKFEKKSILALTTKFRDAGRRSAPWQQTSKRVPGRPQDGKDGNRITRWSLPSDHKFYANEIDATLVEVKYYLQALSMSNAPKTKDYELNIKKKFTPWLVKHEVTPGTYLDPLQRKKIDFNEFIKNPRIVQSGHLIPLDREGKHIPKNTFLMLSESNQMQGNQKIEELLKLMEYIVTQHKINPI